jgi:hypothetical protein
MPVFKHGKNAQTLFAMELAEPKAKLARVLLLAFEKAG